MANRFFLISALIVVILVLAEAHGRWKCPPPRDANDANGNHITFDNTANKYAACGPQSGNWGFGAVTNLKPGWNTISWEESINHKGAPFRVAILDETETAKVVLLDHIPHNDNSNPVSHIESTYFTYQISVNIPDIKCDKCSLQFLYLMTDKNVNCGQIPPYYYDPSDASCKGSTDPTVKNCAGAPNDTPCKHDNVMFSNYHSCSDVTISGINSIDKFSFDSQPSDWPYKYLAVSNYGTETGTWSDAGWLQGVPSNYTTTFPNLTC